jgi:hypothetical protein
METTLVSYLAELREGASRNALGYAEALTHRVKDLEDLCLILISEDEVAFASSVLFDADGGIFAFLDAALHEKTLAKAREKALDFVKLYIAKIKEKVAPYALFIRVSALSL